MLVHKDQKPPNDSPRSRRNKRQIDFSRVGGLSNHLKTLRDLVIFPLQNKNLYSRFNIKVPRGILFHGPPGTGKTLLAHALVTEINNSGLGKVAFFHRKGADVLSKWIGETEKKLAQLFDSANKSRPAVIFFDEIDGLAPVRSCKHDHIHCSVVTTLLALMDELGSTPGVMVIAATNRIDSVDPALRRAGRFDRELYFPPPSLEGRKEILKVHTDSWLHKPSPELINKIAEATAGFCGSEIESLCTEAVLCYMKRQQLDTINSKRGLNKSQIDQIRVEECDFLNARRNVNPCLLKMGEKMRKLDPVVKPLLQRQLDRIVQDVKAVWPHFFERCYSYLVGEERYAGRVLLFGNVTQAVNTHIIPAMLLHFEHLPHFTIEASSLLEKNIPSFMKCHPCVLIVNQLDQLWEYIDTDGQIILMQLLENIFTGLPILIIASCSRRLPPMLHNFFFNNTTVIKRIKNPLRQEVEEFFAPLFFGKNHSLTSFLKLKTEQKCDNQPGSSKPNQKDSKFKSGRVCKKKPRTVLTKSKIASALENSKLNFSAPTISPSALEKNEGQQSSITRFTLMLSNLLGRTNPRGQVEATQSQCDQLKTYSDSNDANKQTVFKLWKRTIRVGVVLEVAKLEMTYDAISASINFYKDHSFEDLAENVERILEDIEYSLQSSHHT